VVFFAVTRDINHERRCGVSRSTYSAASAICVAFSSFSLIAEKIAYAIGGETLFPIILKECHTVG